MFVTSATAAASPRCPAASTRSGSCRPTASTPARSPIGFAPSWATTREVVTGSARGDVEHIENAEARDAVTAIGGTFGGLALVIAMFVVASTIGLSVLQRQREVALLRAVAATPKQVRRMIRWEIARGGSARLGGGPHPRRPARRLARRRALRPWDRARGHGGHRRRRSRHRGGGQLGAHGADRRRGRGQARGARAPHARASGVGERAAPDRSGSVLAGLLAAAAGAAAPRGGRRRAATRPPPRTSPRAPRSSS